MKNIIEMKEIYHSYKEKEVLKGISLTVKKGEIIGLLGPSGVGKTTVKKYFHDLITGILYSLLNLFILYLFLHGNHRSLPFQIYLG